MFYKRIALLFFTAAFTLTSCNAPVYNQTQGNVADAVQRAEGALQKSDASAKPAPALVINQGLYVDKTQISLARQPGWLKNKIVIRGDQLPFSYYSRTIVGGSGKNVLTHYQTGLDETAQITMNYSGSVKGALDLLAAKSGYVYTVNGDEIYWQAFITKSFDVAFMPGSSDYMMGKSSAGGSATPSTAGGGTGGVTVTGIIDDSAASQYSSLKGSLSVWKDLEATIKELLSKDGKVMVSEATTTVTVRDRPTNVALVGQYVNNLNSNLSKQVLVKIQVLDVDLSSDFNFGIDWQAIKVTLGRHEFLLNANYGTPVSISPFTTTSQIAGGTGTLPQVGVANIGNLTGVTALINALKQQGNVSIVTEPRVVCLNNQVSAIRIVNQRGYIASVQNTTVAGASGAGSAGTITSQITPGTVVTGFTLYVLPKILGERVYLQVNADLSTFQQLDTLSAGTAGTSSSGGTASVPQIQAPRVTQKQFNQRSVIGSGDTLILAGFRQMANNAGAMQLFDSQDLGGKASHQERIETIVLITPIILHGYA